MAEVPDPEATDVTYLETIDGAVLTPIVQRALGLPSVELIGWRCEQLHTGAGWGTAVYGFTGEARFGARVLPWALILKAHRPAKGSPDPTAFSYYMREPEAYRSGWLADLPGDLAAPRCFGIVDDPDGTCWLWLEYITDDIGGTWPPEQYGVAARHLGQFNGAYIVNGPLPDWPWLASDLPRKVAAHGGTGHGLQLDVLPPELSARWLPGDASDRLLRAWGNIGAFLDAFDRLPQTLCHFDAFRRNLFARMTAPGAYQTLAVDWEWTGRGPLGFELVPLVQGSVIFFEAEVSTIKQLEAYAIEGYLQGLHDAGWRGDPRLVRLGYTAASLRYRSQIWHCFTDYLDEGAHESYQRTFNRPIGECCDVWAQLSGYLDDLADEAQALMGDLL